MESIYITHAISSKWQQKYIKKGVIYEYAWNRHVDAILGCSHADEINKLEILLPINHIYIK